MNLELPKVRKLSDEEVDLKVSWEMKKLKMNLQVLAYALIRLAVIFGIGFGLFWLVSLWVK